MNDQPIQIHPEAQRLIEQNRLLREKVVRLLTRIDELLEVVRPNLTAIYCLKIGEWEYRELMLQFEVARLKRHIELIQAAINRRQRPDLDAIRAQLDEEYRLWQIKIEEEKERITAAETRMKHLLSEKETRKLKKLYFQLAKRLHPDANPNVTDEQRRLWLRVQSAFAAGDLAEMQALALLAKDDGAVLPTATTLTELSREQETLRHQIKRLLRRIATIESEPPFTLRQSLEDDAWVAARRAELENKIDHLRICRCQLESHLDQLLAYSNEGTRFSQD